MRFRWRVTQESNTCWPTAGCTLSKVRHWPSTEMNSLVKSHSWLLHFKVKFRVVQRHDHQCTLSRYLMIVMEVFFKSLQYFSVELESVDNDIPKTCAGKRDLPRHNPASLYVQWWIMTWLCSISLYAGGKFQYWYCTLQWFSSFERTRRALQHSCHGDGTLIPGQYKSM